MFTAVVDKATGDGVTGADFNTYIQANLNTGLWVPIARLVAVGAEAELQFTNIPQDFYGLVVSGMGRSAGAGSWAGSTRFNGDAGANYYYQREYSGTGTGGAADEGLALTNVSWISTPSGGAPANSFGPIYMEIADYASVGNQKHCTLIQGRSQADAANNMFVGRVAGHWLPTTPISSLSMVAGADGWAAGSFFSLYGLGGLI